MTTPASPYLAEPLILDHRNLEGRARARGTSVEFETDQFIQRETGGIQPDGLAKLNAKQARLESQIADLEAERGQQLAVAAQYHRLVTERDHLAAQLGVARQKHALHRQTAEEALQHAKARIGTNDGGWDSCGGLLGIHISQTAIADKMEPLIDELSATLTAAEEAVLSFGREHGITPTAQPKG